MRHFIVAVFISVTASALSLGADCSLNKPLRGAGDMLLKKHLRLTNLVLSAEPQFTRPKNYTPGTDALHLELFNIEYGNTPMGYVGGKIGVVGKLESVGFSYNYLGNFAVKGSTTTVNGVTTYQTINTFTPVGAHHAKGDAVTQVLVRVEKGDITAITLTHPKFKVWKQTPTADYLAFTGEHQTLCVYDAQLP